MYEVNENTLTICESFSSAFLVFSALILQVSLLSVGVPGVESVTVMGITFVDIF